MKQLSSAEYVALQNQLAMTYLNEPSFEFFVSVWWEGGVAILSHDGMSVVHNGMVLVDIVII